ncbi:MAG: HAD family hydrolase [Deltaproteobacteria bacterium]|nr:HAD family hydrolase [Deltaproteobacteria bacterium]MBW2139134.1 HAD family hydrolase [Deltaproteobacteria bacterium]
MVLEVKWCGFDYGQCIMEPGGLRNPRLFGDLCKTLGKPELIPEKIRKYRILKEKYGSFSLIKEGHRDEIYSYVLDDDPEAVELFGQLEQDLLDMGEGLTEALDYLKGQGIELQVVSEMKKTLGPVGTDIVSRFLKRRGLVKYFKELVTPQGKINLEENTVDPKYKGFTKKEGTLYDVLAAELRERGIEPHEAVMVGDKPETDIDPAHDRGFKTIQYKGFIDYGDSKADVVIHSFEELKGILTKKE